MNKSDTNSNEGTPGTAASDLRSIREAKGISLRDIFEATRITTVNLEAIEEGRFHVLPEPVYAKTFIKTYARSLGIDSQPILDRYDQYVKSLGISTETVESPERRTAKSGKRSQMVLWVCISVVAFSALFYLFLSTGQDTAPVLKPQAVQPPQTDTAAAPATTSAPTTMPDAQKAPAAIEQPPKETVPPLNAQPAAPAKPEIAKTPTQGTPQAVPQAGTAEKQPYRIVIKATEKTWVRIQEDGKRSRQVMMGSGDTLERSAAEKFIVDIGNAGGVEVVFQGKSLGPLGKTGEVVHLKLP